MNRGRLAIFSPDGPIENFFIESDNVAIGRSSGNDLVIDRHGISRYHASISLQKNEAELLDLDSVNGTYVDGLRLNPRQPRVLRGGEEIQIGDIRLVYYAPSDIHGHDTVATRVQSVETAQVTVNLEGPEIAVAPGTHAPATLHITNTGNQPLKILLSVDGLPGSWARLDRTSLTLQPESDVEVGITFKPVRRPESKPGTYVANIQLDFPENGYAPITLKTKLEILSFNGFGAVLSKLDHENGETFQLYIHNQGNAPLPLRFTGEDKENRLQYYFQPDSITLDAGERSVVSGTVKANRPIVGGPSTYEFALLTHALTPSGFVAPISGRLHVQPMIGAWRAGAFAIMALLFVGILISSLFILGDGDETTPQIEAPIVQRFVINGSSAPITVNIDSPLQVEWDVDHAESVVLNIQNNDDHAQTTQYRLAARQDQPQLIYLDNIGSYSVVLEAQNDDLSHRVAAISIDVIPTLRVNAAARLATESTMRPMVYRNVVAQEIVIDWYANWGSNPLPLTLRIDDITMTTLDNTVDVLPTDNTYSVLLLDNPPQHTTPILLELSNAAIEPVSVVLPVVYPTCTVATRLDIYATATSNGTVLVTLANANALQIDGRTTDNWLRIILPSEARSSGYFGWVSPNDVFTKLQCSVDPTQLGLIQN